MAKLEVSLSPRANQNLQNLLNYLEDKWSKRVQEKFISKLDEAINQISMNPYSSIESEQLKGIYNTEMKNNTV
jgi:plasmid stabilization system protein ParE